LRYLLERIQLNHAAGLPRKLAITSTLSGEGVTFIARALGAVIGHDLERTVCVVDLNWWSEHAEGDVRRASGLAGVIEDGLPIDDAIKPPVLPNLHELAAGVAPSSRRSLLANSPELAAVVEHLGETYEHVVLDLPAVLVTSNALTLARLSDAVALVVRQGVTTDSQVATALDELRGVVSLGVILNKTSSHIPRRIRQLVGG
jgi:Mrp family chromosome partitioning ATPase